MASRRLSRIAERFGCKTYLEIGVFEGNTFFHMNLPHKTAVDPHFRFEAAAHTSPGVFFFEQTSDDFFAALPQIQREHYGRPILYDLIYLDGMHTFAQTILDFVHTLPLSHAKTIWVLDDTIPCDPWSALPDNGHNQRYRTLAGVQSGPWHGDVYKCIFALHDYFLEYSWRTQNDAGNGQTIVWKMARPAQRSKLLPDMDAIKRMTYFDLLDNCHALHLVKDAELLSQIGSGDPVTPQERSQCLAQIIKPLRMAAPMVKAPQTAAPARNGEAPCSSASSLWNQPDFL